MNALPTSIEEYLLEAGFSSTELLILKKLLEGEALTLRQIAAKTGKSTGVLDQSLKKLLRRNVIRKEWINDTFKYTIVSLQAIVAWMEQDMRQKQEMMKRRHQNFEAFIRSVEVDQRRPEMQYYEGDEGMMQAYRKLLDGCKETLHYFPVVCAVEDDPLRDFRVDYFRERRRRGIFSRFVAHNTPLGRRFATRDPFEYRKTVLVPEAELPITFEKVVAGDTVACFNHAEKRVCFIRFPELAAIERALFERLWQQKTSLTALPVPGEDSAKEKVPVVPMTTRTLSGVREFFLSRKSLALFALFAVVAGAITYGLYQQNVYLNTQRIRERAIAIATTGAMQFDANDIEQIHTAEDVKKPAFQKILGQLRLIESQNEHLKYVYIHRPTGLENTPWEVVADVDFGTPPKDINGNGVIEESEDLTIPGQKYSRPDPDAQQVLEKPTSILVSDEWGKYFDSSAPIHNAQGKTVAVLYVDVDIQELFDLTRESFAGALCFFGFFSLFVFIRLTAFNRRLFMELIYLLRSTRTMAVLGVCSVLSLGITYGIYRYTLNIMLDQVGTRLMSIAATAAPEFMSEDLALFHVPEDMKRSEYQRVFKKLNEIRSQNEGVKYVYIMRLIRKDTYEFVADADSNFGLPLSGVDANGDGKINEADEASPPGAIYDATGQINLDGNEWGPFYDKYFVEDQWGINMYANAPIYNSNNEIIATLGVDMDVTQFRKLIFERYSPYLCFFSIFVFLWAGWIVSVKIWEHQKAIRVSW